MNTLEWAKNEIAIAIASKRERGNKPDSFFWLERSNDERFRYEA